MCFSIFSAFCANLARVQADRSGCNLSLTEAPKHFMLQAGLTGMVFASTRSRPMVQINGTMRSFIRQGQGSTLLARTFGLVRHGPLRRLLLMDMQLMSVALRPNFAGFEATGLIRLNVNCRES